MHERRTIAIDDPRCLSVHQTFGFTRVCFAKTAAEIEVLLAVETLAYPRNIVLDGALVFPRIRDGFCQITLALCLNFELN